jgi:hypothetical protein
MAGNVESVAACDLSVVCPVCDVEMEEEHAHMRCTRGLSRAIAEPIAGLPR